MAIVANRQPFRSLFEWAALSWGLRRCGFIAIGAFCCQAYAETDLQLQLLQSQYLGGSQNNTQNEAYSSFGIQLKHHSQPAKTFVHGLNIQALASMDGTEQAYVAAPEFYWGLKLPTEKSGLGLVIGRQRFDWSNFDEEWSLGIWQPYVRWDYLHPQPQGLTGAFFSLDTSDAKVMVFATPLFLPDQGPQFEVVDGEFRSSNRWFRQPTSKHTVINQDRKLSYELDRPSDAEVVMNAAYGLSILLGNEEDGPWLKTSLASKPINQMHLGIEGYHSIARPNRYLESVAVVHPTVARHSVMTVEAGYRVEDYQGWISVTEERPDRTDLPDEWEESSLYSSRFIGMTVSHRLPWVGWRNHWLKYSAMSLTEDLPPPSPSGQQDTLESSLDRYPYKEVLSAEWTAPVINRATQRLDLGLRYLYSVPEKGSLLSAKLELVWQRNTRWDLGFDILGTEASGEDQQSGLMSLYRNNDRISGGVTYVF